MSSELRTQRSSLLPPGSLVAGKYRIDQVLAEGGMGVIYRGWHLVLDQPIAIKVMRPELSQRPEAGLRFLNEARSAARLRGANVARVLDSGAIAAGTAELLYIVLEYLEGADLRTVLEDEGALPLERAVDFVMQACEGLAEAHLAGIVHRDVKPENLFLTRQPDGSEIIKLLDFGISKRADGDPLLEQAETQSLGSPHYMAPEQVSAPGSADGRADIWSIGIVLYELLTLRVPFDAETLATVCAQVLGRDPESPRQYRDDLPVEVEEAILSCLEKDRQRRPATVRELARQLAPFGTAKAAESLRRIDRMFERKVSASDPDIQVDVDLTGIHSFPRRDRRSDATPSGLVDRSRSVPIPMSRVKRRNLPQRIAIAAAAAAALAIALPGTTMDEVKAKTAEVLSPIGAHARLGAERLSQHFSRHSAAEPAPTIIVGTSPNTGSAVSVAPRPAAPVRTTAEAATPAAETQPEFTPTAPKTWTAQRRQRWQRVNPERTREASAEVAESSVAAPQSSPSALGQRLRDRLIAPYAPVDRPVGSARSEVSKEDAAAKRYGLDDTASGSGVELIPAYEDTDPR